MATDGRGRTGAGGQLANRQWSSEGEGGGGYVAAAIGHQAVSAVGLLAGRQEVDRQQGNRRAGWQHPTRARQGIKNPWGRW
jgi:hypothetical protein